MAHSKSSWKAQSFNRLRVPYVTFVKMRVIDVSIFNGPKYILIYLCFDGGGGMTLYIFLAQRPSNHIAMSQFDYTWKAKCISTNFFFPT